MVQTVQISPLKRMPFNRHYFDYSLPTEISDKIRIGQLVKAPLRKTEEYGIVTGFNSHPQPQNILNKLKPISGLVFDEPALTEKQIDFLKEISEMYFVSFNFILKTALPPIQKTKLAKEIIVPAIIQNKKPIKPVAFFSKNQADEEEYIKNHLSETGQNLIMVPTVEKISFWENRLKENFKNQKIITIGGVETEKETFVKWFIIRNNPRVTVIATRSGLFCPWTNLANIFMTDEGSFDYKSWDMAPRIQTRDAVLILGKHFASAIHFLTHGAPSVETYFFAKNKIYNCPSLTLSVPENQPWITDTRPEKFVGNFTELSRAVEEEMQKPISGDVFLFLNRRGENHTLYCRNCKKTIACPDCGASLSSSDKKSIFCPKCSKTLPHYNSCPACRRNELVWIGLGTTGIKKLLREKFGNRYEIMVWEKDNQETEQNDKEKIIIGTKFAFTKLAWDKIKLIAFLDTDSSLYLPEYKTSEELWQTIHEVTGRCALHTKIILQTENPEHPVIASLPQPEKFYNNELGERRLLGYPPYNYILKMFYGAKTEAEARQKGEELLNQLKNLTKQEKNVMINGLFVIPPEKSKNLYFTIILAKIHYGYYKTILKKISQILPADWKTDPNPNKLLGF